MRNEIGKYDLEAYQYNQLYLETYEYMKKHDMLEDKLFLIDVTNLTLEEQVKKVKEFILCQV